MFCHYGIEAILYEAAKKRKIPFILSGVTNNEVWWNPGSRIKILAKHLKVLPIKEKALFGFYQSRAYLRLVDQRRQFPIPGSSPLNVYQRANAPSDGPETIRVFNYLEWDQNVIEKTLQQETGWQKPPQTLTWRYDCILEPLLDFTFKREFGISSAGLYLCGLIRSGGISREEAVYILNEKEEPHRLETSLKTVLDYLEIPLKLQKKFLSYR
jgi:hypothetical protein